MTEHKDYSQEIIRCAAPAVNAVADRETMRISAVISTGDLNRMGQRVNQQGWDFTEYRKNPIVLFGHDDSGPAIGKNISLEVREDRLHSVTEFAPTDFGREVFTLYAGGYMRAWSVGFQPTKTTFIENDQGEVTEIVFEESKLLEYSAVAIPANADAVSEALHHGLIRRETHDLLLKTSQSLDRKPADEAARLVHGLTGSLNRLMDAGLSLRVAGLRQSLGISRKGTRHGPGGTA